METKRTFIVGDEWLYYKIYCGHKTSDKIIAEIISPITQKLKAKGIIKKWFFIRYADPEYHLRIRFHLSSENSVLPVVSIFKDAINKYIKSNLVWKIVIDTYQREIERYGNNSITFVEDIFCNDSVLTSKIIYQLRGKEGDNLRWLIGIRSIDEFLNSFDYKLLEKFEILTIMKDSFEKEHNINKHLKSQLSSKYRKHRYSIENILNYENDLKNEMLPIFNLIKERDANNKLAIEQLLRLKKENKLEQELNKYMWSYLHMLNNRLFRTRQRTHELVVYYLLYQYYRSKLARKGLKIK